MTSETTGSTGRRFGTREAAFIGVGAMVGAGIFSLLGTAGEVAGSAVWISFLLAGIVAALQGYSFAKLGARFPSAGGLIEYINQGFGAATSRRSWPGSLLRNIIVTGDGGGVVRQLRELRVRQRRRGLGEGLRDRARGRDDRRSTSPARTFVARVQTVDRVRRHRDPRPCSRSSRSPTPTSRSSRRRRLPERPGHRLERRPDVLRVPRLRRRHLHGPRTCRTRHASCRGRWASPSGSRR